MKPLSDKVCPCEGYHYDGQEFIKSFWFCHMSVFEIDGTCPSAYISHGPKTKTKEHVLAFVQIINLWPSWVAYDAGIMLPNQQY